MATREDIKAIFSDAGYRAPDGTSIYNRNWNQMCQALTWRLCEAFGSVPVDGIDSAKAAYNIEKAAGRINTGSAPAGKFVYFEIGTYGHVGFTTNDSGEFVSGTKHLAEAWGINAGVNTIDAYCAATGARYLGYSDLNGGNSLPFTASTPEPTPTPAPSGGELIRVQGDGVEYWEPVGALAQRIGAALETRARVDQPFKNDGYPGSNWRKGVQRTLANAGLYSGAIDGKLGPNNLRQVQEYAKKFGDYDYLIDGDPQVNSWSNFALGLERP